MLRGIDVSSWQPRIDWQKVAASGVSFAIVKATGGNGYRNPYYPAQISGARAAGLAVGHYHYAFESSLGNFPGVGPEGEAAHFLSYADILDGEPIVLDFEEPQATGGQARWALDWLNEVEQNAGFKPMFYSYPDYIKTRKLGTAALANFPLWFASYPQTPTPPPFPPTPGQWSTITIWQWSAFATIPGIGKNVDENLFDGTLADFKALGKGNTTKLKVTPFVNPDPMTGIFIHEYFLDSYDFTRHGRPLVGAALYSDGIVRQLFERACLGSNGRGQPTVEGLGQAYSHLVGLHRASNPAFRGEPDWPAVHPL